MSGFSDGANFVDRIEGAHFGGLGDRNNGLLSSVNEVEVEALGLDEFWGQFAVWRLNCPQLEARHLLGSTALVGVDVRGVCANHGLPALGRRRKRNHVSAGAVEYRVDRGLATELFLHNLQQFVGHGVCAIGPLVPLVYRPNGLENLRVHARIVVAGKTAPDLSLNHGSNLRRLEPGCDPNRHFDGPNLLV